MTGRCAPSHLLVKIAGGSRRIARLSGWFMGLALPGNQGRPLRAGLWLTGPFPSRRLSFSLCSRQSLCQQETRI